LINSQYQGKILGINQEGNLQVKISSLGATTKISCPAQKYQLSYSQKNNFYQLIERNKLS